MTRPLVEELEKEHISEFGEPLGEFAEGLPEILHYPRQPIDVRSLGFPGHMDSGIFPRFPQPSGQRWFWHLLAQEGPDPLKHLVYQGDLEPPGTLIWQDHVTSFSPYIPSPPRITFIYVAPKKNILSSATLQPESELLRYLELPTFEDSTPRKKKAQLQSCGERHLPYPNVKFRPLAKIPVMDP